MLLSDLSIVIKEGGPYGGCGMMRMVDAIVSSSISINLNPLDHSLAYIENIHMTFAKTTRRIIKLIILSIERS